VLLNSAFGRNRAVTVGNKKEMRLLTCDPAIEIAGSDGTASRRASPPALPGCRPHGTSASPISGRNRGDPRAGPRRPDVRVLILTTFEQDDYIFGDLRAGAAGFLLKRPRPEELIAAVHTIAAGGAKWRPPSFDQSPSHPASRSGQPSSHARGFVAATASRLQADALLQG
jgi:hypothetical protein